VSGLFYTVGEMICLKGEPAKPNANGGGGGGGEVSLVQAIQSKCPATPHGLFQWQYISTGLVFATREFVLEECYWESRAWHWLTGRCVRSDSMPLSFWSFTFLLSTMYCVATLKAEQSGRSFTATYAWIGQG
jgi:hypothetical protein